MTKEIPLDDAFIMLFAVTDKLHHTALVTSASKKNIALLESLTYRQQKALVAILSLTENAPGGVSLTTLATCLNMTIPSTSVLVDSMVQNKIFLRIPSLTDRRVVCIKLSDFGDQIIDALRQKMNGITTMLMEGVSEEDKTVFKKVIKHFHEKLFS